MERPTKRERNELFEAIGEKGLDPADCELVFPTRFNDQAPTLRDAIYRVNERSSMTIRHVPTGSEFWVRFEIARYGFQWEVTDGPTSGAQNATKEWGDVREQAGYWAEEVKYVATTPDFWDELTRVPEIVAAVESDASNAPFTAEEQGAIARGIDGIRQLVRDQFELTTEQLAAIDQRLDDAEQVVERGMAAGTG